MVRKRIEWVDMLKGLAIILVMLGHCTNHEYGNLSGGIHMWIYTFHMPLFFFLSGFVFSTHEENYKKFVVRKLKSIIIPMVCFNIIQIVFEVFYYMLLLHSEGYTVETQFKKLFETIGGGYLWFLPCLFIAENIFYIIIKLLNKYNKSVIIAISGLLYVIGVLYVNIVGIGIPWKVETALLIMPFFTLGYVAKSWEQKTTRYSIYITGISLVLNIIFGLINYVISDNTYVDLRIDEIGNPFLFLISAFCGILAFYFAFRCLEEIKALSYIGRNSIIFYGLNYMSVFLPNILIYQVFHTDFIILGDIGIIVAIGYAFLQCLVIWPFAEFINRKCKFVVGKF